MTTPEELLASEMPLHELPIKNGEPKTIRGNAGFGYEGCLRLWGAVIRQSLINGSSLSSSERYVLHLLGVDAEAAMFHTKLVKNKGRLKKLIR